MKHAVYIYKERKDCNVRPVLYPYMASESTKRFCRKFSCNSMGRIGEIKTSRLYYSPDHQIEE